MDSSDWKETPLRLDDLRGELIRQEVTILFALIERAQFLRNEAIYQPGRVTIEGSNASFFEYMLEQTERVHAQAGRYLSCDENPFTRSLPTPLVGRTDYPEPIFPNIVNRNPEIADGYRSHILAAVCRPGDDGHYGSSATCDIACLQALSRRIHYGKHIAEAKFQADRDAYRELIGSRDASGIEARLVDKAVERAVLGRVRDKAAMYGSEPGIGSDDCKVSPEVAAELFADFIIPLTIEVEVDYLLARPG